MQVLEGRLFFSPHDLLSTMQCNHRLSLDFCHVGGLISRPKDDAMTALIKDFGNKHEERVVQEVELNARSFLRCERPHKDLKAFETACQATIQAMSDGVEVIYQGTLFVDGLLGFPDLLQRTEYPDGFVCYEPIDIKSSRSERVEAIVQTAAYGRALELLGCCKPRRIHLRLASESWSEVAAPYLAFVAYLWEKTARSLPLLPKDRLPDPTWGERKQACTGCLWQQHCLEGRQEARDLSLLPEIRTVTMRKFKSQGVSTVTDLAACHKKPTDVATQTFEKLQAEASLQQEATSSDEILWRVWNMEELLILPPRSPGDVWFDIEGFPFYQTERGLEYLFGYSFLDPQWKFERLIATNFDEEKKMFENFIDFLMTRWSIYPNMHVYHYASYERTALTRLAQLHGTREVQVDKILRDTRLIDLYSIIRKALIFSTQSLSLKSIEPLYGTSRAKDGIDKADESVVQFNAYLLATETGDRERATYILNEIIDYNKKDVESIYNLNTWLGTVLTDRSSKRDQRLADRPPLFFTKINEQNEVSIGEDDESDVVASGLYTLASLLEQKPSPSALSLSEAHAIRQLADVIRYHERERKAAWWRVFALIKSETEQLLETTGVMVPEEVHAFEWSMHGRQRTPRRQIEFRTDGIDPRDLFYPEDDLLLLYDKAAEGMKQFEDSTRGYSNTVSREHEFADRSLTVIERLPSGAANHWMHEPVAVLTGAPINAATIRRQVTALGEEVLQMSHSETSVPPNKAWADILVARPPRGAIRPIADTPGANFVEKVTAALHESEDSYVAIQGPPGTGKTRLGAEVAGRLVIEGWRMGIIAQSHEVIENFMKAVEQHGPHTPMAKKPRLGSQLTHQWHVEDVVRWGHAQRGGYLIGGTAWSFAREGVQSLGLELMVIDEAGQFTLASSLGALSMAKRALLLGDPQQLAPVSQASHATAVNDSVLGHLMQGAATMPPELGFFLSESYRMHPALARAVSALQYDGRLESFPFTANRELEGVPPGLITIPVLHEFAYTRSVEEAEEVTALVQSLMGREWIDADMRGRKPMRPLTTSDILVVAPFNDQVRLLKRQLKEIGLGEILVGTVDKMQGRQAVVTIVSMTASNGEDLPRGLEFLLSPNRLNVAISRSQWATYLIYSPELLNVSPTSTQALRRLANFVELVS